MKVELAFHILEANLTRILLNNHMIFPHYYYLVVDDVKNAY